jgi:hypothetical protein
MLIGEAMNKKDKEKRKKGSGSIFKRHNSWFIGYYVSGTQFKEKVGPVGLTTKGQAEQALKARMGEIVQGKFNIHKVRKGISLNKLIGEYLENKKGSFREKIALDRFAGFTGNVRINDVTSWTIEQYKSHRKESVKPGTINRE